MESQVKGHGHSYCNTYGKSHINVVQTFLDTDHHLDYFSQNLHMFYLSLFSSFDFFCQTEERDINKIRQEKKVRQFFMKVVTSTMLGQLR